MRVTDERTGGAGFALQLALHSNVRESVNVLWFTAELDIARVYP